MAAPQQAPPIPTLPRDAWLTADDRVVLLAHGQWGHFAAAKTALQVLRYSPAEVLAVIDPTRIGQDAAALVQIQHRGRVPIHGSLQELLDAGLRPTRVVVGVAPNGGRLPDNMRVDVRTALTHGIPVLSGMHAFLADDPEWAPLARAHGAALVDLRQPPDDPRIADGSGRGVPVPVILTIGTDCRSGKMTVAVALREAARAAGLRAAFVATGQTGLLLSPDAGAPIDRVIGDFAAGEVERQVLTAARLDADGAATDATPDLILVEGQGALTHPAYGGVSLALLHGAWPDQLVVCHVHGRTEKAMTTAGPPFPVHPPHHEADLAQRVLSTTTGGRAVALAVAAPGLSDAEWTIERARYEEANGLPTFDVLRDGASGLLQTILAHARDHPNGKRVVQPARRAA